MTDWIEVARLALTSRSIDRIEEQELAPQGRITYQFSSRGHELAQVLLGLALDRGNDAAGVYYRSRPFMLASGLTPREAFAADMALTGSPSEGRDVGVVFSMQSRGRATVLPSSGDVGAQYTPAAGWAQAIRYHAEVLKDEAWKGAVAVVLGGDGSVATNGFWAALVMAATMQLPLVFMIEDNGFGISVPRKFQTPGGDISANLKSFHGLKILNGSGTTPEETAALVAEAVAHARGGSGPVLLHVYVPRLTGHTFGEDQTAYKSTAQIEAELRDDPLLRLREKIGDESAWGEMEAEVERAVRAGLAEADEQAEPAVDAVLRHVFAAPARDPISIEAEVSGPRINMSEAIRRVLDTELEGERRVLVFGEDVGPRGGVHRVTLGLQAKFGEDRVFDTSLSEEGIVGRAQGLALAGLRPVPEIQFRKYADPAYEQMHDIGWVRWRTAGKFTVPLVVRMPYGFSRKTGDPWHSVSDEAVYAHMQGWRIAVPSNAADAAGLLREALRGEDPTVFLEHRALYDAPTSRRPYPGDGYRLPFGVAAIVQEGPDLTVVSWGEMLHRCLEAAGTFKDRVEVIDLRTIAPWDRETVLGSVRKTGKLLIAHEDTRTVGFAAEIGAVVAEEAFTDLDAPVARVTTPDVPIPYNIRSMEAVIPGVEVLRAKMEELLAW
ncbi:MAG TPA: thiamine pyrophosphate-dependent enzyme [Anaerolineales bacterium]|nr:thiamine pyrophosphate-dependent enzyme [Anaerolineales bacterium]